MENPDEQASILPLQAQDRTRPSLSPLTSELPHPPLALHPEGATIVFSSYCQYAIFFTVNKKKVIILRNNMHRL